ncbi:hypothetical protein [Mycobacterium sp. E2733]|uniref:hypothetical protein n=1 Tax=Mycobacterium sp. E2733 TaxID=1834138 RepID=UPI0018D4C7A2|nr:hypothetical protein [Mycobacterium sp. E2733]
MKRVLAVLLSLIAVASTPTSVAKTEPGPWHYDIVATNFWVGEVLDPNADDGSQEISAYDNAWMAHYGGCDGIVDAHGVCGFEYRSADNGFFPRHVTARQNPFYLDLPLEDQAVMQHRWVQLQKDGHTCYGQVEDAGPAVYDDRDYVLGTARPKNTRFNGAGMDVSPALYGCLGFTAGPDAASDKVNWRFVDASDVPAGPWTRIVTGSEPIASRGDAP